MKMRQKIVGNYFLGYESVRLVAREGTGASFYCYTSKGQTALIEVGMDDAGWVEVAGRLMHEAIEFALIRAHARFKPSNSQARGSDEYVFFFTHPQLDSIAVDVAEFITTALPDFSAAYKKWRKPK
jgi:hypothetical protein